MRRVYRSGPMGTVLNFRLPEALDLAIGEVAKTENTPKTTLIREIIAADSRVRRELKRTATTLARAKTQA